MSKEKQEPAFPVISPWDNEKGMSKRFYAACTAMQGILASMAHPQAGCSFVDEVKDKERIINASYQYADELLKQEE